MILALIACALSLAAGSEAELTNVGSLGSIEEVYLDRAKAALQCRADPKPEGKKVRAVRAVVFEAITPDDPWPDFFGRFHIETKSDVVTNESLLQPGDAWSRDLAWQTEYNLLNDYYLSIARVVACEVPGATAAAVDILIVVKDLWSLRGSLDPRVVGGTLEYLYFSFGEFNILGRNKKATVDFLMDRSIYSLGGTVTDVRINGSRWSGELSASALMNRSSLQSEGGAFSFDLNRPLYALTTEWGYGLSLGHSRGTSRVYSATDLLSAYQQNMWNLEASITRSFGRAHKTNVTLGYRGLVKRYTAEGAFAVPRSEEAGVVFARWQDYPAHYRRYFDRETYLLPEDYRLGHLLEFELAGAAPVFGFTSSYLEASGRANYRWAIGEGLLDLSASTGVRYQPEGAVSGSPWVNRWVTLGAKATSGTFGPFFVVAEGAITGRDSFQNPTFALLGGATYLRGFPSNYLVGTSLWRSNFEVRTKPLRGSSIAAGAAAYLDLGDAFTSLRDLEVHASAGVGLRFLFPEFNRRVLRVDLATPLETTTVPPAYFILTFGQGF